MASTRTNPLIERREVAFEIHEASTPGRVEVRRELAAIMKTGLEKVWVRKMETKTGTHLTVGLAHVYDEESRALEVEPEHIIRRNTPQEASAEEDG